MKLVGLIKRRLSQSVSPRSWSNVQLRRFADELDEVSSCCNVSGWRDSDKEGRFYRDYFPNVESYFVTNFPGDSDKGVGTFDEIELDLLENLPPEFESRFDLTLSHTVLEHVRRPDVAFANICLMSRKYVITVVPFVQGFHFSPGNFGDFYRFSPMLMRSMYEENGFRVIDEAYGPPFGGTVYLAYLGVRSEMVGESTPYELKDVDDLNETLGHQTFRNSIGYFSRMLLLAIIWQASKARQRLWRRENSDDPSGIDLKTGSG